MLLDEIFLGIDQRATLLILRMTHVGCRLPYATRCGIGHLQIHVLDQLVDLLRSGDAYQRFDSTVEVAVHQIGGTDPHFRTCGRTFTDLRAIGVRECVDTAVLEETDPEWNARECSRKVLEHPA